jgi:dTMP kinase
MQEIGRFIAFEGCEGSGKTTQIKILSKTLTTMGVPFIVTREPGGTPGGEDIRTLLKQGDENRWGGLSEALLLYAARHDHVEKVIKPAVKNGTWVLCDRFSDSSFAYQGFGRELGLEVMEKLHTLVLGDFFPDLTLIFDAPPKDTYKRVLRRRNRSSLDSSKIGDRFDDMAMSFHERVYEGYHKIAEKYASRCAIIQASDSIDAVQKKISQALFERLGLTLSV